MWYLHYSYKVDTFNQFLATGLVGVFSNNFLFLQEAKAVYEKALEIDPNNLEAKQGIHHCSQSLRNLKPEDR